MTEDIILILMVIFSIVAIHQHQLRTAVICLGAFSLLASVAYLMHHAPDVAIAEAVIGSTIATVLYLVVLRKQERLLEEEKQHPANHDVSIDLPAKLDHTPIWQRIFAGFAVFVIASFFVYLYLDLDGISTVTASAYYKQNFIVDTSSLNAVTAIYLNYRVYDTFFETLTLLVSVFGVVFLSRFPYLHLSQMMVSGDECRLHLTQNRDEQIPAPLLRFISPFILILSLYMILNGHISPGGGFQGGAILAAVFILRYMTQAENDIRLASLQTIEKVFFILIIAVPSIFLLKGYVMTSTFINVAYLILMNMLIGLKVGCGISIIFIRYVYYESR